MPAVVSLLGQELDVTVVVDGGSEPPQRLTTLVNEGIVEGRRIIMLGQVLGTPPKADIEDVFTPDDYLALFDSVFGKALTVGGLDPATIASSPESSGQTVSSITMTRRTGSLRTVRPPSLHSARTHSIASRK